MNPNSSSRLDRRILAGLLILLILLVAVLLHVLWPGSSNPELSEAGTEATAALQPASRAALEDLPHDGVSAQGAVEAPVTPPVETGAPPQPANPVLRNIRVRLVDTTGYGIGGVTVKCQPSMLPGKMGAELTRAATQIAVSGADGWLTVFGVHGAQSVAFELDDPAWIVLQYSDPSSSARPSAHGWTLSPAISEQTVVLARSGSVTLEVRYADGQPVTGRIGYSVWVSRPGARQDEAGIAREPITLEGQSSVSMDGLPPTGRLWGNVFSQRAGFAVTTMFDIAFTIGGAYVVTVPLDDTPQHGLEIDLSAVPEEQVVHVMIIDESGARVREFSRKGPSTIVTKNLHGYARTATVWVFGAITWRSEPIDLSARAGWQRVVAVPQDPAAVRFRVIGEEGEPLFPAVAVYGEESLVDWRRKYSPGETGSGMFQRHFACSDKDGIIVYGGLPGGAYNFAIEAQGYLRVVVPVSLTTGREFDAGTIRLVKATSLNTGSIEVRLDGIDPAATRLELKVPTMSGQIRPAARFSVEGTASFDLLEFREYQIVIVQRLPGSDEVRSWFASVALSAESPSFTVTVSPDTPQQIPASE